MNFTDFLSKHYLATLAILVLVAMMVLPFPTQAVPEGKVLLIDRNYLPGGEREIEQIIENDYFGWYSRYRSPTDKNGFANLPPRYLWAGASRRVVAAGAGLIGYDISTKVTLQPVGEGCESAATWQSGSGRPLPERIVCPFDEDQNEDPGDE